jgi:uncharacterized UBP type Zn finger protein
MGKEHKKMLKTIQDLGFTEEQAKNALFLFNNKQEEAIEYLL